MQKGTFIYRAVYLRILLVACLPAASCAETGAASKQAEYADVTELEGCRRAGGVLVPRGTNEPGVMETPFGACKFEVIFGQPDPIDNSPRAHRSSP